MAGRRASQAAINGARRRGAALRAARRAQGDEIGRAGASGAASIPGRVERVGAGARVRCVGA